MSIEFNVLLLTKGQHQCAPPYIGEATNSRLEDVCPSLHSRYQNLVDILLVEQRNSQYCKIMFRFTLHELVILASGYSQVLGRSLSTVARKNSKWETVETSSHIHTSNSKNDNGQILLPRPTPLTPYPASWTNRQQRNCCSVRGSRRWPPWRLFIYKTRRCKLIIYN